jgi:hypothetical protein
MLACLLTAWALDLDLFGPEVAEDHPTTRAGLEARELQHPCQREEAQEHLATATTMYRDMDMPFWLEQAEEERKVSAGESLRSSTASGSTPARPL